jgi:hypothetical protein
LYLQEEEGEEETEEALLATLKEVEEAGEEAALLETLEVPGPGH